MPHLYTIKLPSKLYLKNVFKRVKVTDWNGEAGFWALTTLVAVQAIAERSDARWERRECQVVVIPLTKQGHEMGELLIAHHGLIRCVQNEVWDLPDLSTNSKEKTAFFPGVLKTSLWHLRWYLVLISKFCFCGHTRGSRKLLNFLFWSQPIGSEMPSSYSAGNRRVKGVLEAPKKGLFLENRHWETKL